MNYLLSEISAAFQLTFIMKFRHEQIVVTVTQYNNFKSKNLVESEVGYSCVSVQWNHYLLSAEGFFKRTFLIG